MSKSKVNLLIAGYEETGPAQSDGAQSCLFCLFFGLRTVVA